MVPGPTGRKVKSPRHGQGSRWLAVWNEPDGRRRKKAFRTKDAAEAHLEDVGVDKRTGSYITVESRNLTITRLADDWVKAHPDWAPSTRVRNLDILRVHVLPRWGDTTLGDVTEEAVQDWVNDMTVTPGTMRRHHQVLSGILTLAVRRKKTPANVALHVTFPTGKTRKMTALTVREVDAFVAAHPEEWRTWARFLAYTGLRVSEAAGLRVRNVDLDRRRVVVEEAVVVVNGRTIEQDHVKTDAGQGRKVPLVAELIPLLRPLVESRGPQERVFRGRGGAPVNRANYSRRQFRDAITTVGHPGMTPHELRHTAVSLAIRSGASPKAVQAIAGHKDASMTLNVYSHLFDDDLDSVSDRMEAHIAEARKATGEETGPPGSPQGEGASP